MLDMVLRGVDAERVICLLRSGSAEGGLDGTRRMGVGGGGGRGSGGRDGRSGAAARGG